MIATLCSCSWFRSGRVKWNGDRLRVTVTWSELAVRLRVDNQAKVLCVNRNVNNQNGFEVSQVCPKHVQQDQVSGLLWIERGTFGSRFRKQQGEFDLCFAPAWKSLCSSLFSLKKEIGYASHTDTVLVAKFWHVLTFGNLYHRNRWSVLSFFAGCACESSTHVSADHYKSLKSYKLSYQLSAI